MKKIMLAAVAVAGLTFLTTESAEAGHRNRGIQIGFGNGRFGFQYTSGGFGYRHRPGFGPRRWIGYPRYGGWYPVPGYCDYYPGGFVPHVPPYYVPGHWHP